MAWKSLILFVTLFLASFISQGLAQEPLFTENKASILECWSALYDLGFCYGAIARAAVRGKPDVDIGQTCCKAAINMDSGCWPRIFPFNPYFPSVLQNACSRYSLAPTIAPLLDVDGLVADAPSNWLQL